MGIEPGNPAIVSQGQCLFGLLSHAVVEDIRMPKKKEKKEKKATKKKPSTFDRKVEKTRLFKNPNSNKLYVSVTEDNYYCWVISTSKASKYLYFQCMREIILLSTDI